MSSCQRSPNGSAANAECLSKRHAARFGAASPFVSTTYIFGSWLIGWPVFGARRQTVENKRLARGSKIGRLAQNLAGDRFGPLSAPTFAIFSRGAPPCIDLGAERLAKRPPAAFAVKRREGCGAGFSPPAARGACVRMCPCTQAHTRSWASVSNHYTCVGSAITAWHGSCIHTHTCVHIRAYRRICAHTRVCVRARPCARVCAHARARARAWRARAWACDPHLLTRTPTP